MKLKNLFPIIGIVLFLYILFKLDISSIISEIKNANINYLLVALFFVFFTTITQTWKWLVIAKVQKIEVPFWKSYRVNLIGMFYGFITPSRIGSAVRIAYLKSHKGYTYGKGASNYVLEKIFDLASLFFLAGVFSFVFQSIIPRSFLYYSTGLLVLLLGLLLIFRDKERSRKFLGFAYRKLIPEKIKEKVRNSFHSFYEDMPKNKFFFIFFMINLFNWIILYAMSYFIGLSLGIGVPFFYFLAILPIATLVGQIPITISGLGTREATLISLFGLLGVSATKIFSMAIIGLLGGLIPALIGGILIFWEKK